MPLKILFGEVVIKYVGIVSAEPGNDKTRLQSQHGDNGGKNRGHSTEIEPALRFLSNFAY